jgi:D-serine deaminase-like pyridoxal phosphate-dependent protein
LAGFVQMRRKRERELLRRMRGAESKLDFLFETVTDIGTHQASLVETVTDIQTHRASLVEIDTDIQTHQASLVETLTDSRTC